MVNLTSRSPTKPVQGTLSQMLSSASMWLRSPPPLWTPSSLQPVLWLLSLGRVSLLWERHSRPILTQVKVLLRVLKCLFVLDSVRSQVPQEVDTSRFACHQGISHTLSLLKRHFWWPMELWKQIPMPLSLLACSVLEERPLIIQLLACYAFYLFQVVPGPTLLSTRYQSSSITM